MPRPKYAITSDDVVHAIAYLRTRLQLFAIDLGVASNRTANNEFNAAIEAKSKEERARGIQAWCEEYLSVSEWTKLKASIRKRRERKARKGDAMTELRIRDIDEWIVEQHRHNARKKGITLGEEIKTVLSDAVMARRYKLVEELEKNAETLRAKYGTFPSCVPVIREMREGS